MFKGTILHTPARTRGIEQENGTSRIVNRFSLKNLDSLIEATAFW